MRTMRRPSVAWMGGAMVATLVVAPGLDAQQREPYPATLYHGTGLIDIPVAWVSPRSADAWVQTSAKTIPWAKTGHSLPSYINTNISIDTHWAGRFSLGATAYSQNPDYGFFGQAVIVRDEDVPYLPALAVGFRNLGNCKSQDRFGQGCDVQLGPNGDYVRGPVFGDNLKTRPTFYGVATQEFGAPGAGMGSISVGWGSGLFKEHVKNRPEEYYSNSGTLVSGLFLGGRYTFHPTLNTTMHLLAENNGFDYNLGLVGDWRGISVGAYVSELEEGGREGSEPVYNYTKFNVAVGYSGNIIDISRGVLLRTRITELTREQMRLRMEINNRERRIRGLEVALRRAQAGELAGIEQRRRQIDEELQQERRAIEEANKRLEDLMRQQRPPTTPPSNPPSQR